MLVATKEIFFEFGARRALHEQRIFLGVLSVPISVNL
jgi:hypothetical protein